MVPQMQLVLGSQAFLKRYFTTDEQNFRFLRPVPDTTNYALLDLTGRAHFTAPIRFDLLAQSAPIGPYGFIHLRYFRLTEQEAPVFITRAKTLIDAADQLQGNLSLILAEVHTGRDYEYVMVSQWAQALDVFASRKTPLVEPITAFTKRAAEGSGAHDATYQIVGQDGKPLEPLD